MSKIVAAVNAMIANEEKIGNVIQGAHPKEIFFSYDTKFVWSIKHDDDGHYSLWFFPDAPDVKILARIDDWHEDTPMVYYSSEQIGTAEAFQTFQELYTLVKEKVYGMDKTLDEIINNSFF
jgi:hypothetical protein